MDTKKERPLKAPPAPLRLDAPLTALPSVGEKRAQALGKLGLFTIWDLLDHIPRDYEDHHLRAGIAALPMEKPVCFSAMLTMPLQVKRTYKGVVVRGLVTDGTGQVELVFFNRTAVCKTLLPGQTYLFYGTLTQNGRCRQLLSPRFWREGDPDFSLGWVPVYPLRAGITEAFLRRLMRKAVSCLPQMTESLSAWMLTQYRLLPLARAYEAIHFPETRAELAQARRRLAFEELLCLQLGLSLIRGRREGQQAIAMVRQNLPAFLSGLPFALTQAQLRVLHQAAADLQRPIPMNRLLQGDVGSGKTVVAAACAWIAFQNGCQTALMAPTEILARQHQKTMNVLLAGTGLRVGLLTGALSTKEKRQVLAEVRQGEIDLLVGTHALLSDPVTFSRLGLVITDEQHRFGVGQRAALTAKGGTAETDEAGERVSGPRPHVLVMSATPIPRTLALMLYGDLDLSVIDQLPPGRTPVKTLLIGEDKRQRLYGFVRKQVALGRQVYIVCPAVSEDEEAPPEEGAEEAAPQPAGKPPRPRSLQAVEELAPRLQQEVFPDLTVGMVHGQMKSEEKQAVMEAFTGGKLSVLVSTTVVEVGVDVPNATLMIIENAERFGLSQLHQLRGRVGRGGGESYCVLLTDSRSPDSLRRLKTFCSTTDGFRIAEEDLRQRGPGDFFGAQQHGLPALKLASLERDLLLLESAQEAARTILNQDKTLSKLEHKTLRAQIQRLFFGREDSFQ